MEGRESLSFDLMEDDLYVSGSSIEKEPTSVNNFNSVKTTVIDSVTDQGPILPKKQDTLDSITTLTSEFISIDHPPISVEGSIVQRSQSKSQITSVNVNLIQNKNSVSNTYVSNKSSYTSRLDKDVTYEIKEPSSNYISWEKSVSRDSLKTIEKGISTKPDKVHEELDLTYSPPSVKKDYISPWAEAPSVSPSSIPSQPQLSRKDENNQEGFNLKCIPPWAKTIRKIYGMPCSDPKTDDSRTSLQEKIKGLMDKHSRLMLVKRGESRKQLILEPKGSGEMGTVKMTSKNTRFYMTPLPRTTENPVLEGDQTSTSLRKKMSVQKDEMSVTKKTSRSQAKTEVSHVLKSLYNSRPQREMYKDRCKIKQDQFKCPKITPSKIREYVNAQTLDPDERKLHEIIKIKKVPSLGTQDGRKPSSKYIINVPKCTKGDGTTVNKITVKEKHKLRLHSVEDINENITEIIYNKSDSRKQEKLKNHYKAEEHFEHDVVPFPKSKKSPTKSRTLEVSAESTPLITELLKKEERNRDKILLIQYESKSKPCEGKSETDKPQISTQLLGVKQTGSKTLKEMYLYGTETDGKTTKENVTKVDDVSPTLREKVNMIFQELREMTFKPCAEPKTEDELHPSVSSKTFQYPSILVETDAVSVQALPDVRSAEVQVHDSVLLSQSELQLVVPQSTPTSLYLSEKDGQESIDKLEDKTTDIVDTPIAETESKTLSQSKFEQLTDIGEGFEEIDDTMSSDVDEEEISQDRKHSLDDIVKKEITQYLETTEDKEQRSETVTSDVQPTNEDQEEIVSENKLTEELLEKDETLKEEDFKSEERGLKHMEDDAYSEEVKDFTEEIEKGEAKEDGKYSIEKIDEKHPSKEDKVIDHEMRDEPKATFKSSDETKTNIFVEDIRSYDFDSSQESVRMVTSSKFFHQRDSIKKMNWPDDLLYLEKHTCPQLVKGLAEIAVRQPADPISFLANWIYKHYHNQESEELKSVYKEHMEVAKSMLNTSEDEKPIYKKFSIRRYPIKSYPSITSIKSVLSHPIEETDTEELKIED